MNAYAVMTDFLYDSFDKVDLVNTTIFGEPQDKDLNKINIFPLVNIAPESFGLSEQRIEADYYVSVVSLRHIPKAMQVTKKYGDNLIDNLNECASIITQVLTTLELAYNDFDIVVESYSKPQPIIYEDKNLLDGWEFTITLSIQNEISIC